MVSHSVSVLWVRCQANQDNLWSIYITCITCMGAVISCCTIQAHSWITDLFKCSNNLISLPMWNDEIAGSHCSSIHHGSRDPHLASTTANSYFQRIIHELCWRNQKRDFETPNCNPNLQAHSHFRFQFPTGYFENENTCGKSAIWNLNWSDGHMKQAALIAQSIAYCSCTDVTHDVHRNTVPNCKIEKPKIKNKHGNRIEWNSIK